jgi:serine protease Do
MEKGDLVMIDGRKCGIRAVYGAVLLLVLAVPVHSAQERTEKSHAHPYLGVMVLPVERGEPGIIIRDIATDSPAAKAGLKDGDRVMKIDDKEVTNVPSFLQMIAAHKPNDQLRLHIMRTGQAQDITVTLGERPAMTEPQPRRFVPGMAGGRRPAFLGVQTVPISPDLKSRLQLKDENGIVVTEVVPNSAAAKAGLKVDDVITALDIKNITHPDQLREVILQTGPGKEITVQIIRGGESQSIKATLAEGGFGTYAPYISQRFPGMDDGTFVDPGRRMREMERRIEELERRVQELEKKVSK